MKRGGREVLLSLLHIDKGRIYETNENNTHTHTEQWNNSPPALLFLSKPHTYVIILSVIYSFINNDVEF